MLKLKELRFSGIGRFVDEQVINFELLGKLAQLDGLNKNTKGSSGAGKSTVFQALDYLFGINDTPGTVLHCRYTDNPIIVTGTFDYNGKPLVITMGKKLRINEDGKITEGNSKLTEEALDKIMAIPRDLFRPMMHKRQKEGGFFLNLAPKDTNEFLIDLLELKKHRKDLEILEKKIELLKETKTARENNILRVQSALQGVRDALVAAAPPTKDVDQAAIVMLKTKADASLAAYSEAQARHKTEIEALGQATLISVPFDRKAIEIMEDQVKFLKDDISKLQQLEKDRQTSAQRDLLLFKAEKAKLEDQIAKGHAALTRTSEVAAEIKKIRDSICPTCEQSWANEKAKARELKLLEELRTLKEAIQTSNLAQGNIFSVSSTVLGLQEALKPQEVPYLKERVDNLREIEAGLTQERQKEKDHQAKISAQNQATLSEHALKSRLTRERCSQEQTRLSGQLDVDRRALDTAVARLRAYEEALTRHKTSIASLQAKETEYWQIEKENAELLVACVTELAEAEELKRAVKSHLSCSFDEALQSISTKATEYIRHIPNMANATIQLEGIRETQEGKLKEEVNALIHMDGEQSIDIRSLCGGERTALDLAIDLSVIDLIETKANKGIDIFILDEPFGGLDTVCIEMALEVLKNANTNKKLIIVDHNSEVKEAVESTLLVVRDGLTSRIEQAA